MPSPQTLAPVSTLKLKNVQHCRCKMTPIYTYIKGAMYDFFFPPWESSAYNHDREELHPFPWPCPFLLLSPKTGTPLSEGGRWARECHVTMSVLVSVLNSASLTLCLIPLSSISKARCLTLCPRWNITTRASHTHFFIFKTISENEGKKTKLPLEDVLSNRTPINK